MVECWFVAPLVLVALAATGLRGVLLRETRARLALQLMAVAYIGLLAALTLFPFPASAAARAAGQAAHSPVDLNLLPFATVRAALAAGPGTHQWWILLGNVAAFLPAGFLAVVLVAREAPPPVVPAARTALLAGLLSSAAVEGAQLLASLVVGFGYRTVDVDDVIVNVAGALVGGAAAVALCAAVAAGHDRESRPNLPSPG